MTTNSFGLNPFSLDLLHDYSERPSLPLSDETTKTLRRLISILDNFQIDHQAITVLKGPAVSLYKVQLANESQTVLTSELEDLIAISLGRKGVRVLTSTYSMDIEIPNVRQGVVPLKSILNSYQFKEAQKGLPIALGVTATNDPYVIDLAELSHLLVTGAIGMGKSIALHTMIASLLYCRRPDEIKFVLIDPEQVEFSLYYRLKDSYLAKMPGIDEPVISDTAKTIKCLKWLCCEMDRRYSIMKHEGVTHFKDCKADPLPHIIVLIDEIYNLLKTDGTIEKFIIRLAKKGSSAGIHVIIASKYSPSEVISSRLKSCFNSRISFRTNTEQDSMYTIGSPDACHLLGRGDSLITRPGLSLTRVQCASIEFDEINLLTKRLADYWQNS